ncbi:response regulator [bacterium]|nr:response regulator [bacterium]
MKTRRVYLIDDDADCLTSISFLLMACGYECVSFSCATDFLNEVPDDAEGIVLADHRLQDGNAVSILQALRAAGQKIPLVVISGRVEPEVAALARSNGAAGLLQKPVTADELTRLLDEVMESAL